MPVRNKLCPTLQKYVESYDPDKGLVLENAVGKTVRQMAGALAIAIEEITCSNIFNHHPSGYDHIVQDGDLIALERVLGSG
jgi:hypothetical protein